jgi:hypothetical protein
MDKICWRWTPDKTFSTSSAYLSFFIGQHPIVGAKLLRKVRAPAKCKFFIWLVLHKRCWTADRRKRPLIWLVLHERCWTTDERKMRGLQDDDSCALCNQSSETIDHLLITCPFSIEIWFNFLRRFGWEHVSPTAQAGKFAEW